MKEIRTAPAQDGSDKVVSGANGNPPRDPSKLERVLAYLATGRSLHRFEAEREVNDHCLNSTMSVIKCRLGIPYRKKTENVSGWHGHRTPVARYWLDEESQRKAWERVHTMRKYRGSI